MKREPLISIVVFALLVALGVATRWLSDALQPTLSNFTATGAVAMFAGYFFRNKLAAVLAPLAVMVVSNFWLKPYETFGQFAVVFIALLAPVAIGMLLQRKLTAVRVIGGSLASSLSFYAITNFAEWPFNNLYPHTFAGLVESYVAGLPFFRKTLGGDLFFTAAIFGTYWAVATAGVLASRNRLPSLSQSAAK